MGWRGMAPQKSDWFLCCPNYLKCPHHPLPLSSTMWIFLCVFQVYLIFQNSNEKYPLKFIIIIERKIENFCVKDMMESKRHPNGWVGPSYPLDPPVPALLHILGLFEISDAYHINIFYHVETIAHQHYLTVECKRHTYIYIYIHFKAKPDNPQQRGGTHLVSSSKDWIVFFC